MKIAIALAKTSEMWFACVGRIFESLSRSQHALRTLVDKPDFRIVYLLQKENEMEKGKEIFRGGKHQSISLKGFRIWMPFRIFWELL